MTGSDGRGPAVAGGLARHIPVLGPQAIAHLGVRDGGIYVDGTFGAGGYSRLILQTPEYQSRRHRPRSERDRARRRSGGGGGRPADVDRRPFLRARRSFALGGGFESCRRRRARSRRVVDATRRSRARLLLPFRRAARHAHGRRRAERGRCHRRDLGARSRHRHQAARRGASCARGGARDRARARRRRRSTPPAHLRTSSNASCGRAPGAIHPATRTFQALADFRERGTDRACAGAGRGRAHPEDGRAAGRGVVPFAGRPHRKDLYDRARPRTPASRVIAPKRSSLSRRSASSPKSRSTPGEDEIANNPRARSAKLRAAERTDARPREMDYSALLPRLAVARRRDEGTVSSCACSISFVIAVLVMAAAYVYEIKFESTLQAERLAKLRSRDQARTRRGRGPARRMGEARHARPHPGPGAAASAAEAAESRADRQFRRICRCVRAAGSDQSDPIGAMIGIIEETRHSDEWRRPVRAMTMHVFGHAFRRQDRAAGRADRAAPLRQCRSRGQGPRARRACDRGVRDTLRCHCRRGL